VNRVIFLSEEERQERAQELFETYRQRHLDLYYPRETLVYLDTDPLIENWSAALIIVQPLRSLLPLGRYLSAADFNQFVDRQLPRITETCEGQLLYWQLSKEVNHRNEPIEHLSITTHEDHFWDDYIPTVTQEIKDQLHSGSHVYYLDAFSLSHHRIEVRFNEIRLVTSQNPGLPLRVTAPELLVITDGREFTYTWTNAHWEISIANPDPRLIDPVEFNRPVTRRSPVFVFSRRAPEVRLTDAELEILDEASRNTEQQPSTFESLPPSTESTDVAETWSDSPDPWSTSCFCRQEVCTCGFRPITPPTPPGIALWIPGSHFLPSQT
jgi:hypothetical protein